MSNTKKGKQHNHLFVAWSRKEIRTDFSESWNICVLVASCYKPFRHLAGFHRTHLEYSVTHYAENQQRYMTKNSDKTRIKTIPSNKVAKVADVSWICWAIESESREINKLGKENSVCELGLVSQQLRLWTEMPQPKAVFWTFPDSSLRSNFVNANRKGCGNLLNQWIRFVKWRNSTLYRTTLTVNCVVQKQAREFIAPAHRIKGQRPGCSTLVPIGGATLSKQIEELKLSCGNPKRRFSVSRAP